MTIAGTPVCLSCVNYNANNFDGFTCRAFPDGVPDIILTDGNDHTEPVKGDNGIRFEPIFE